MPHAQLAKAQGNSDTLVRGIGMHPQRPQKPTQNERATVREDQIEQEFIDALDRIYRLYGRDLSAFRRDVQEGLVRRDDRLE